MWSLCLYCIRIHARMYARKIDVDIPTVWYGLCTWIFHPNAGKHELTLRCRENARRDLTHSVRSSSRVARRMGGIRACVPACVRACVSACVCVAIFGSWTTRLHNLLYPAEERQCIYTIQLHMCVCTFPFTHNNPTSMRLCPRRYQKHRRFCYASSLLCGMQVEVNLRGGHGSWFI